MLGLGADEVILNPTQPKITGVWGSVDYLGLG